MSSSRTPKGHGENNLPPYLDSLEAKSVPTFATTSTINADKKVGTSDQKNSNNTNFQPINNYINGQQDVNLSDMAKGLSFWQWIRVLGIISSIIGAIFFVATNYLEIKSTFNNALDDVKDLKQNSELIKSDIKELKKDNQKIELDVRENVKRIEDVEKKLVSYQLAKENITENKKQMNGK